jgi:hypothetical protein
MDDRSRPMVSVAVVEVFRMTITVVLVSWL